MTEKTGSQRGRPRKPTALRILHGQKVEHDEPTPGGAVTRPPLTPGAQAEWDRIAPEMISKGVLTEWDVALFAEWCESLILLRAARVRAAQELTGQLVTLPGHASPMASYSRALINQMALAGRFGLTPADRARLSTPLEAQHGSRADLIS
jgi:phage terminase small subunit